MTTSSRFSKKDHPPRLSGAPEVIDRVFGRDIRSHGWVVDLARLVNGGSPDELRSRRDEPLDPAMIWVMRGRRR